MREESPEHTLRASARRKMTKGVTTAVKPPSARGASFLPNCEFSGIELQFS
jgi:hypothetical protein